jgi:hypothetical protein
MSVREVRLWNCLDFEGFTAFREEYLATRRVRLDKHQFAQMLLWMLQAYVAADLTLF